MTAQDRPRRPHPLLDQLRWFIALRWVAGIAVILGTILDRHVLLWYERDRWMLGVGGAILAYNGALWWVVERRRAGAAARPGARPGAGPAPRLASGGAAPLALAWTQILLDLGCLTLLVLWTGATHSALLGFTVFHMVFASLLLPRFMAYGGASAAMLMLVGGLWATDHWPTGREEKLLLMGWFVTLLLTVYLANHITTRLRRQHRHLMRQNRHIRAMSRRLRHQQRTMIQQEKMIALGQMAAGVAHEIANPLASMDSLLQLMQRKPERLRPEALTTLRTQISRIHQIVQQMTAYAHPNETAWQTLGLNEAVEHALDMLAFDRRLEKVKVQRQLAPDAGMLRAMPQALQQVLVNLVLNALDAMADTPAPLLVVRTRRDGASCFVEVADNGHGIQPQHIDRLFEPFFTTKPVGKGTGLGLAISYSLVRKHGGQIDVQSQVGVGTTFTIRLPALAPGLAPAGTEAAPRSREVPTA